MDSDQPDTLWHCAQSNYFYGVKESFELRADGSLWKASVPLTAAPGSEVWQAQGQLSPAGLQAVQAHLHEHFYRLETVLPPYLVPDDFARVCRASLAGQVHQVEIYANSPETHKQCLQQLERLFSSGQDQSSSSTLP